MDAYASTGMPLMYNHWSFGKHFLHTKQNYLHGRMGLAYEIVINSNPCIAYLMEENTITMQVLVLAHASYGHNSFFKGNYLFQTWTDADSIIDYLLFAKNYIAQCEEKYGVEPVEEMLDACHALMNQGVNRYKRPHPLSAEQEKSKLDERADYIQRTLNDIWSTIPKTEKVKEQSENRFPQEPEENLLYFFEKNAPLLETWQREILRITRKIAQYYFPQKQTQVMNEGWACFWHYHLLHELYSEGKVSEGFMLEFLHFHSNVINQPSFDGPNYRGINPYTLGFSIFMDIKRICEEPTDEDRHWFPDISGSNWLDTIHFAMQNFKDESFILQFLSPKVIRDLRLFTIMDDESKTYLEVDSIHNQSGYKAVRESLSAQYNLGNREPNIQIHNVNIRGDRKLTLRHYQHQGRPLGKETDELLKHLHRIWQFDVEIESFEHGAVTQSWQCSENSNNKQ